MKSKSNNRAGPKQRASKRVLQFANETSFKLRSQGPRPAGRKPRKPRQTETTVKADIAAIMAITPPNPGNTRRQLKVEGIEHLFLRVYAISRRNPSGRRVYVVIKHVAGKLPGVTLGTVDSLTLSEAALMCRIAALEWRNDELEAQVLELQVRVTADA